MYSGFALPFKLPIIVCGIRLHPSLFRTSVQSHGFFHPESGFYGADMRLGSIRSKLLNGLSLLVLAQVLWALPLASQAPTRPLGAPAGAIISPTFSGTGKESKYLEWAPKLNAAFRDFQRGRRTAPSKVFADFLRTEKKNPIPRKFLSEIRSEERRVGKEGRSRGSPVP